MARDVYIGGQRFRIDGQLLFGQGGEAEVYDLRPLIPGQALALKLWKPPDHPDFQGNDEAARRNRAAAELRLKEYGMKIPVFPSTLPERVIAPVGLVTGRTGGVIGYTMKLLEHSVQMRQLALRAFRESSGIDHAALMKIFQDLHLTVGRVHHEGVVIGDFNYMNVLVRGAEAHLIDADSMQFGSFRCHTFHPRFVDPLVCDPQQRSPVQSQPHSADSDWYAFGLMLFECLMYVSLYGGVYDPKDATKRMPPDSRPLKRVSVFDREVIYPKKAMPLSYLPREVVDFYSAVVDSKRNLRGEFPPQLMELLLAHAEGRHWDPSTHITAAMRQEVIRGALRTRRIFQVSNGTIVRAALEPGPTAKMLRVVYHKDGYLRREDDSIVLSTELNPALKYRTCGTRTLVGFGSQLAIFEGTTRTSGQPELLNVDLFQGNRSVFDSNGEHYYWLDDGRLYRNDSIGRRLIGSVLRNQTLFWVGPRFGFGFYRIPHSQSETSVAANATAPVASAGLSVGFVFDAKSGTINDRVALPPLRGELLDARVYFSSNRAWVFVTLNSNGSITNQCFSVTPHGNVSAVRSTAENDGSWLGTIYGKCAATVPNAAGEPTHRLFAATDSGLVAIDDINGSLQESVRYPDTEDAIGADAELFYAASSDATSPHSIYVVSRREVWLVSF